MLSVLIQWSLAVLIVGSQCVVAAKNEWQQYHYRVFASSRDPFQQPEVLEPLGPDETLEYLKKLDAIYAETPRDKEGKLDERTKIKWDKVRQLLAVSHDWKCFINTPELNRLVNLYDSCDVNLVPYLEFQWKRLYASCRRVYFNQVEEGAALLRPQEEESAGVSQLVDHFEPVLAARILWRPSLLLGRDETDPNDRAFAAKLLDYLESRGNLRDNQEAKEVGAKGRAAFKLEYDRVVGEVCGPYKERLESVVDKYKLLTMGMAIFKADRRLPSDDESKYIHKWLAYSWICSKLTAKEDQFLTLAHNLFFDRHHRRGVFGHILV